EAGDLLPVAEALQMLRLAEIERGDIRLTEAGMQFVKADTDERKRLFSRHLLTYGPLAAPNPAGVDEGQGQTAPERGLADELEDYMAEEAAQETLRTVISWGRYAEAFAYDDNQQAFSLDNPA